MTTKLTIDAVMGVIRQAKIENTIGSILVPRVDPRIREIVSRVDDENREPTREDLLAIIHAMGYKPGGEPA